MGLVVHIKAYKWSVYLKWVLFTRIKELTFSSYFLNSLIESLKTFLVLKSLSILSLATLNRCAFYFFYPCTFELLHCCICYNELIISAIDNGIMKILSLLFNVSCVTLWSLIAQIRAHLSSLEMKRVTKANPS